ncbi:RNA polymerase I-specific transcription initiation factor RRN3 [Senna tora]|uniref:RNA polymerase I-specific transcription initiation factor RRN3 n=1 Tax=Senna tora TaxID=362788 RepID=A0A834TV25_9FABA|nr:RNA polymerase I-specific transcription initiation factor RRN3 [Senna tora]
MGRELASDRVEFHEMENDGLSDYELKSHVIDALASVQLGNRDNYDELVGHLHLRGRRTADQVALLVTTLKALSEAVFHIDSGHHEALLSAIFRLSMWHYGTDVMDALRELIISLATSKGEYVDFCLEMLVRQFVPPLSSQEMLKQPRGISLKYEVLSRVHAALKNIADVVPIAPKRLSPIVVQRMPNIFCKELEIVLYVENMLKLDSGAIGEIVGVTMLPALVDRMIDLDVDIGWDGSLQDDAKDIFEMELEDVAEPADDDDKDDSLSKGTLRRISLEGNEVAGKLDSLMVLTFEHLESCQSSDRLPKVFDVLLESFQKTVINAYKSKFTQFVMFYACALDPEGCGLKFAAVLLDMFISEVTPRITKMSAVAYLASYLSRAKFLSAALVASILQRLVSWCSEYSMLHDVALNPQTHKVFYSGCQAIMYVLCFRLRSLMDVPRLKMQLLNMPIEPILKHKLSPLTVCLPTVVEEFLRQAKAAHLFTTSESFVFNDVLESDLSRAFGGMDRLDMFFPFDPCLLKKSDGYIHKYFIYWSMVRTTYDSDDNIDDEDIGSESENDDDTIMGSFEEHGLDIECFLNRMSITPKNSKYGFERMPSRIRPSTSPESL